jgi:hypothetical protein
MSPPAIPSALLDRLHADIAHHGALGVESGMFLLASHASNTIDTLALAGTAGVTRHRDHFALSGKALALLFRHARDCDLHVLAQVHSHREGAFLSASDLRHGFAVEDFTTSVVPNYRRPTRDPASWGWWRYDGRRWASTAPYTATGAAATAETIVFDERGIRAR